MITRVEIEGFKSIKSLDLELENINIFLGGNGVGKSNFISMFSILRNIYNHNFQNYIIKKGGVNSLLHFGAKHTELLKFVVYFKKKENENKFMVEIESAQNTLFIKSIRTAFKWGDWTEQEYEKNVYESNFREINTGQAFWVNDRLKEFEVYHFHDTSDTSPMKGFSNLHDNDYLRRDGSNLASFLYYLRKNHKKEFKRIVLTIREIAPFFEKFKLKPNKLNKEMIQLEWREKGFPETYFNAFHLSDGTLRFICLATLLLQPNPPKTIIIDEPELGLHPVAINKLSSLIRKVSSKSQVIISTQSVNLIDNFDPNQIIVANRHNGETDFKRLKNEELQDWLEDYTLGDLWGQNKIGAQPYNFQ